MLLKGLSTPDDSEHLNAIFYGDTGVGKTALAGSAALVEELSPVFFIDVEGGGATLRGLKGISTWVPSTWADVQEAYDYLRHEDHPFKTVVIDSLTEVQEGLSLGVILGELDDGDGGYSDLSRAVAADRQDWLRTGVQMRKIIRAFRSLAKQPEEERRLHVIMTALEKLDDKRKIVAPELSGKLGPKSGAYVDILGRLSVIISEDDEGRLSERRHLLLTNHEGRRGIRYLGKNRLGRLGRHMWEPTAEKIYAAWMGDASVVAEQERIRPRRRDEDEEDELDDED